MLNWLDIANLRRAASQIDAEIDTWLEGLGIWNERKKRWILPEDAEEWAKLRVMRLENSARFLRNIATREVKKHPADYQI